MREIIPIWRRKLRRTKDGDMSVSIPKELEHFFRDVTEVYIFVRGQNLVISTELEVKSNGDGRN